MMKILYVGYAVNKEKVGKLSGSSIAGNKMQLNILNQLTKKKNIKVDSITVFPIATYPIDKIIFFDSKKEILFDGNFSRCVKFINLPGVKQISQIFSVYKQGKKLLMNEEYDLIFTYNMFPQIGIPSAILKKKYNIELISILADLPIDDTPKRKFFNKFLRTVFDFATKKMIFKCDKIIVLNKNAQKKYAPNTDYLVIEGGIDILEIKTLKKQETDKKNIVYSGALVEYNGIENMLKAMSYIEDVEVILDIYGDGPLQKTVEDYCKNHDRINYHGRVDNEEMKRIQSEAFLLLNPRPINDSISDVTFPSKIFEYMVSGTPVLTTKLSGFTNEYMDKMFFVKNNDSRILASKIDDICSMSNNDIKEIAEKAQKFILENKTWDIQGDKIIDFIL